MQLGKIPFRVFPNVPKLNKGLKMSRSSSSRETLSLKNKTDKGKVEQSSNTKIQTLMKAIDITHAKGIDNEISILYLADGEPERFTRSMRRFLKTDLIIVDPSDDYLAQPDCNGRYNTANLSLA